MSFGKLKRQFLFFAAVLLSLLFSCSSESETNSTKESGSDNFIKKMAADTTWKTYKGTIPCADCQAIAMELKIKDGFTIESYQFELKETYLKAENGKDKTFTSKGKYNFWRGNTNDPDATIIVLNDDSSESAKRFFLRVSDKELKVVDKKGDEIESKLNFSLKR